MKKYLFIYFILLITQNTFGQDQNVYINGYATQSNIASFTISRSNYNQLEEVKGNPYYNKEWMFGELKIKNDSSYSGLFKYNINQQQMEMIHGVDTFIISNPLYVEYVKFANKTFIYSLIFRDSHGTGKISGSYFEAHNNLEDNFILLSKFKSNINVNDFGSKYAGGVGDGSKKFETNKSYYVRLYNGPAQRINLSKKRIVNLFPDKKIVKEYIKEHNLSMISVNDVASLFNHFNNIYMSDL
ncbi:MAG: hypothetical protein KOO66_08785 [Bacteroidales bacterium]|nr:hypothetical protein [Bacteroidales bacterium]